ncbi:MAG: hypothetical protein JWO56_1362, partial [Acidobacteria bacterium]|nr:hypothetical protein [Acidobacteriota bacterium]
MSRRNRKHHHHASRAVAVKQEVLPPLRVEANARAYAPMMAFGMQALVSGANNPDAQRFGSWGRIATGPNDSMWTYRRDRNRVREQAIINPMVRKALQVLVSNTVQDTGFDPYISQYPAMSKKWKRWKKECDPRDEFGWVGLLYQIAYLLFRDGGAIVRKRTRFDDERTPRSGMRMQIQVMEIDHLPEQVNGVSPLDSRNQIVAGVERDPTDKPVRYWLHPRHPDDSIGVLSNADNTPVPVDAADIILVKLPGRPGEARTSPYLRTALAAMKEMGEYLDAEGLRKKMAAQRVFWIQTPGVGDDGKIVRDLFGAYGQDAEMFKDPNQPSKWIVSTPRAGQSGVLPPGYTVKIAEAADVGANFEPYVRVASQHISAGAGIPHPFLTEDYGTMNDRMYRAITLEFRRTIKFVQKEIMIGRVCERVWEWFVAAGELNGIIDLKGAPIEEVLEVDWTSPAPGYIHPVQEVEAYTKAFELGILSLQQISQELGKDPV